MAHPAHPASVTETTSVVPIVPPVVRATTRMSAGSDASRPLVGTQERLGVRHVVDRAVLLHVAGVRQGEHHPLGVDVSGPEHAVARVGRSPDEGRDGRVSSEGASRGPPVHGSPARVVGGEPRHGRAGTRWWLVGTSAHEHRPDPGEGRDGHASGEQGAPPQPGRAVGDEGGRVGRVAEAAQDLVDGGRHVVLAAPGCGFLTGGGPGCVMGCGESVVQGCRVLGHGATVPVEQTGDLVGAAAPEDGPGEHGPLDRRGGADDVAERSNHRVHRVPVDVALGTGSTKRSPLPHGRLWRSRWWRSRR